ncbi:MAG: cytochrome c, partial [Anaerolineales bacterium]|nr:cytochrome c [Anaerolineales bacterium]
AAMRVSDYSAERYIRESIVSPDAYVVEGYTPGIMPQNFAQTMTAQDLADVLAFLLLK